MYGVDSIAFEGPKAPDRGYTIRASYLKEPHAADAMIEVMKDGQAVRKFLFPAYKIYNLQAHFGEPAIVGPMLRYRGDLK